MAVKTHYDNLKVRRNASDDAIRAAFRSLVEQYHPSRHPGSAEAVRITRILDEAFGGNVQAFPLNEKEFRSELKTDQGPCKQGTRF
jgi:hypothetical protein